MMGIKLMNNFFTKNPGHILLIMVSILFFINKSSGLKIPISPVEVTSVFGESRIDHFHNGIDFSGKKRPLFPVASGRVLYYRDNTIDPFVNCTLYQGH